MGCRGKRLPGGADTVFVQEAANAASHSDGRGQADVRVRSRFSLREWDKCQVGYEESVVDLILSKFIFHQTHDLIPPLKQLGFGGILQSSVTLGAENKLQITDAKKQAYISVDESGTTAAPLTEIGMDIGYSSMLPERPHIEKFHGNRPFLLFLTDDSSRLMLFAGVYDPGK